MSIKSLILFISSSLSSLTLFVMSIDALLQMSFAILFPIPNIYVKAMFTFLLVGMLIPEILAIKLSEENELLLKGPGVIRGYWNKEDQTAATFQGGWLRSGDIGEIDSENHVYISDRLKDIIITSGGKNITPSEIENQLKFSMFISDAVVIGDKRKYLSCLVMIDQDNVTKFAQDNEVPFTNYTSLCHSDEVQDLIASEISRVNTKFARVETIKKFRLIDQLLDPEDEELTPTMKLKRKVIEDKYGDLINEMY